MSEMTQKMSKAAFECCAKYAEAGRPISMPEVRDGVGNHIGLQMQQSRSCPPAMLWSRNGKDLERETLEQKAVFISVEH